jgi:hypothetical protein
MARTLDQVLDGLPAKRRAKIEQLAVDTPARAKARAGRKVRRGAKRMETRAA